MIWVMKAEEKEGKINFGKNYEIVVTNNYLVMCFCRCIFFQTLVHIWSLLCSFVTLGQVSY